jgi:hypothetical protein
MSHADHALQASSHTHRIICAAEVHAAAVWIVGSVVWLAFFGPKMLRS